MVQAPASQGVACYNGTTKRSLLLLLLLTIP
jgi:hypothetical protein